MNIRKLLNLNNLIGGGKSTSFTLVPTPHSYSHGRLPSFPTAMAVALFVSAASLVSLASCSGDEDEYGVTGKTENTDKAETTPPAATDYAVLLPSRTWAVASAQQRTDTSWEDALKAQTAYCYLSDSNIYFTKGKSSYSGDDEGNVTLHFDIIDCGHYPYTLQGSEIRFAGQTFAVALETQAADTAVVLSNADWRLRLTKQ